MLLLLPGWLGLLVGTRLYFRLSGGVLADVARFEAVISDLAQEVRRRSPSVLAPASVPRAPAGVERDDDRGLAPQFARQATQSVPAPEARPGQEGVPAAAGVALSTSSTHTNTSASNHTSNVYTSNSNHSGNVYTTSTTIVL